MKTKANAFLIPLTLLCFILLSPKWLFPLAAWLGPMFLILSIKNIKPWKSYLLTVGLLTISSSIANYKVLPFPGIFFLIMTIIISIQAAVPYWLNRVLYPKMSGWKKTLIFPIALVVYEYVSSFGGGGTWGSLSYTQVSNSYIIQTASLVGIWGITFLIGWFSSLGAWVIEEHGNWKIVGKTITVFTSLILMLLVFGMAITNLHSNSIQKTVRVAGITGSNIPFIQSIYKDVFGKWIEVDEQTLNQTSPELAELNKGLIQFIENPFDPKFVKSRKLLGISQDTLFARSHKEALAGAKIISWSEALTFAIKSEEEKLIVKGKTFALQHRLYFLMTFAAIHPGKVESGKKFIENKAILFSPSGEVLTTFFKNKPVPVIEPCIPGDGKIPVNETLYGRLATSICYDGDYPTLMQQTGKQHADILLLPSGDWKEISPYHAQMASVRSIENGVSLLRIASGGPSIATDQFGRVIASNNYYDDGEKILVAHLPVKHIPTVYTFIGDAFAWACIGGLGLFLLIIYSGNAFRILPTRFLKSNP